jgi:allantoate deiminase
LKTETTDLQEMIEWLASFTDPAEKNGVTRLLYTEPWTRALKALQEWMHQLGFDVTIDSVGNLFGRIQGETDEVILTGSHLDSVRQGGKYDGSYGIISSILAVSELAALKGKPYKTLEVVIFCEEEGSRFPYTYLGSSYVTGEYIEADLQEIKDPAGTSLIEAKEKAGFLNPLVPGGRSDVQRFVELHIEQGCLLEKQAQDIGIAAAVTGQKRFTVHVAGKADHAGTTPMTMRRDAMEGASAMIQKTLDIVRRLGDPAVATVGQIEASPNSVNVIPGYVSFSIDIRHPEKKVLETVCETIEEAMRATARFYRLSISSECFMSVDPVAMDDGMISEIEHLCKDRGQNYRIMYSGAGHDAQVMGRSIPSALLFVPSKDGISHDPMEFTDPLHLENGLALLKDILYSWAYCPQKGR